MPEISPAADPRVPQVAHAPGGQPQPVDEQPPLAARGSQWSGALYAFGYIGLARLAQAEFDLDGVVAALPLYAVSVAAAGSTDALARRLTDRLARRGGAFPRACRGIVAVLAACVPPPTALPWLAPQTLVDVPTSVAGPGPGRGPVGEPLGGRPPVPERHPDVVPSRRHHLRRRRSAPSDAR
ncbi:hypothetical protein [Embleya sp. NPDC020886]|uniref:hypothetical protein n=1 Tax=Embleya sp. NPDC020886 TaxID=3363980 RepID=UPI0037A00DAA